MFLYGLLLTICYIPGVTGFALPTGWLLLSATLPWILRKNMTRCLNPFLLWAALGLLWTPVWQQGVYDLWKLAILSAVFVLATVRTDSIRLLQGMALGLSVSTVVAVAQMLGYVLVSSPYVPPAGLFFNPNIYGEIACLLTIFFLTSESWAWAALSAPGVFLSQSRVALATLVCLSVLWAWRRWPMAAPIGILAAGLAFAPVVWNKPGEHFSYRLAIWANTIDGLTALGRGPGSFITTYPVFASRTDTATSREEDAHNDPLQLIYQYGLGCLFLLPLVTTALFGPLVPERYLFLAFLAIALFNFPLEIPAEAFLGTFALGRLWTLRPMVLHRGILRGRSLGRWMEAWEPGDGRNWRPPVPLESIHPHQARILCSCLSHSRGGLD